MQEQKVYGRSDT